MVDPMIGIQHSVRRRCRSRHVLRHETVLIWQHRPFRRPVRLERALLNSCQIGRAVRRVGQADLREVASRGTLLRKVEQRAGEIRILHRQHLRLRVSDALGRCHSNGGFGCPWQRLSVAGRLDAALRGVAKRLGVIAGVALPASASGVTFASLRRFARLGAVCC